MSLSVGIVGLPNVGKSSLFNALTRAEAAASNFPFTTIEPNVGVVAVPDERLDFLTDHFKSAKIVPASMKFVDIAGLISGAHKGEGLGNQFLGHIKEVTAIAQVVRLFKDGNVTHVHGQVDPIKDIEVINTELILADIETATKAISNCEINAKKGDKEAIANLAALKQALDLLEREQPLRGSAELTSQLKSFNFLTAKPLMYVVNTSEESAEQLASVKQLAQQEAAEVVIINVKTEQEVLALPAEEQAEYRQELGIPNGLEAVIKAGYQLLNLITFFTAGPKEAHAWPIKQGTKAPQAAGEIHTDFERGFIRAQIYSVEDLRKYDSEKAVREAGRLRVEGRDYLMRDGDVTEFLFNV